MSRGFTCEQKSPTKFNQFSSLLTCEVLRNFLPFIFFFLGGGEEEASSAFQPLQSTLRKNLSQVIERDKSHKSSLYRGSKKSVVEDLIDLNDPSSIPREIFCHPQGNSSPNEPFCNLWILHSSFLEVYWILIIVSIRFLSIARVRRFFFFLYSMLSSSENDIRSDVQNERHRPH